MTVRITATVWCDHLAVEAALAGAPLPSRPQAWGTGHGFKASSTGRAAARNEAAAKPPRWTTYADGGITFDLCPRHSDQAALVSA